jgi:hypothetical protein
MHVQHGSLHRVFVPFAHSAHSTCTHEARQGPRRPHPHRPPLYDRLATRACTPAALATPWATRPGSRRLQRRAGSATAPRSRAPCRRAAQRRLHAQPARGTGAAHGGRRADGGGGGGGVRTAPGRAGPSRGPAGPRAAFRACTWVHCMGRVGHTHPARESNDFPGRARRKGNAPRSRPRREELAPRVAREQRASRAPRRAALLQHCAEGEVQPPHVRQVLAQRLCPGVARNSQFYAGPRDGGTQRAGRGGAAGGRTRLPLTWPPCTLYAA